MVTNPDALAGWMVATSWCQRGPAPSLLHLSYLLVIVSLSRSLAPYPPSLLPPSPPPPPTSPAVPLGGGGRGRGAARSPRWGVKLFFAKPASPLSLLSLPSLTYLFILPTTFIRRTHACRRRGTVAAATATNTWPGSI
jgi:hypothetical protein